MKFISSSPTPRFFQNAKLQQQRIADLKKALQRELRVQTLPNEEPTGPARQHRRMPSNEGLAANGFGEATSRPFPASVGIVEPMADALLAADFAGFSAAGQNAMPPGGPLSALSEVNFAYLKHVVLKFLLSRESEVSF